MFSIVCTELYTCNAVVLIGHQTKRFRSNMTLIMAGQVISSLLACKQTYMYIQCHRFTITKEIQS